jgi:tetratricopeptide (TPR) repeat protein
MDVEIQPPADMDVEIQPPADMDVEIQPPDLQESTLAVEMRTLIEKRDLKGALRLTEKNQDDVASDSELQELAHTATSLLEADPYVRSFVETSRQAHREGDLDRAQSLLDKARELDPAHPDILALESELMPTSIPELEDIVLEPVEEPDAAEALETAPEPTELESELESLELEAPLDEPAEIPIAAEPEAPEPAAETEAPEAAGETAAPAPAGEPAARLDSESEQRIDELLKEGQAAFDKGEYQSAIDAWSRIFLIDIDHAEASRRIELSRKLKAEVERQVEEAFHEAISKLESGETDEAKQGFERVLEMHPGHMGAREYLDKLESGQLTTPTPLTPTPTPAPTPTPGRTPVPKIDSDTDWDDIAPGDEVFEAPLGPGLEGGVIPPQAESRPRSAAPRKRSFMMIGASVLAVVLIGGWFIYSRRDKMFPNAAEEQAGTTGQTVDPIARAGKLHAAGNTAMAIAQLRRLPPDHPQHAEAQALIALWEAGTGEPEPEAEGPSEEALERRQDLMARAQQAAADGENLLALDLMERVSGIVPLNEEEATLQNGIEEQLEIVRTELELFNQGDWEFALPNLWRMHELDPSNKDVVRLMVSSYYNLGLRDLQRGDAKSAEEKFGEALELSPDDRELQRLADFANTYSERSSDLLYRIYVKYHPFR